MTNKKKTAVRVPVVLSRQEDGVYEYQGTRGDYTVRRVLEGTKYPKSGNASNPTPEYRWDVYQDGKLVGTLGRLKHARLLIEEFEQG